jgi:adenosylcobinamide kinase/adenosylcobinamide-phosphate guanylyltransferase
MRRRIENHKKSRPSSWATLEVSTGVGKKILENPGDAEVVIIDCITLLVSNIMGKYMTGNDDKIDTEIIEKEVSAEINGIIDCTELLEADFFIVTNEVGMDLVPANRLGRLYRDLLGKANQMLAAKADRVFLMVAGIPVQIKP